MFFFRNNTDSRYANVEYMLENQILERKTVASDLGVIFDCHLTFDLHIDPVKANSMRMLFYILRTPKPLSDVRSMIILYDTSVRPILNYASVIWSPKTDVSSSKLEYVQHLFLRFASYKTESPMSFLNHNYERISQQLGFKSLEKTRKFTDAMFLFKMFNNSIDCPSILKMYNLRVRNGRSRHNVHTFAIPNQYLASDTHKSIIMRLSMLADSDSGWMDIFNQPISHFKALAREAL